MPKACDAVAAPKVTEQPSFRLKCTVQPPRSQSLRVAPKRLQKSQRSSEETYGFPNQIQMDKQHQLSFRSSSEHLHELPKAPPGAPQPQPRSSPEHHRSSPEHPQELCLLVLRILLIFMFFKKKIKLHWRSQYKFTDPHQERTPGFGDGFREFGCPERKIKQTRSMRYFLFFLTHCARKASTRFFVRIASDNKKK